MRFRHSGLVFFALFSTHAFAGGWVSGGGNLLFDDANPWFIQNTEDVNYCIEMDEDHFGAGAELIRARLNDAITYWSREIGNADVSQIPSADNKSQYDVFLGTQRFTEVSCDQAPAIRFQFGVLTKAQRDYLREPKKIVGVAVRTQYDRKLLRARGFIYLSPEHGPLGMQHPKVVKDVWTADSGKRIQLVLMHELGHIFGLPHTSSGSAMMDHDFPETVVTAERLPPMLSAPTVFRHASHFSALQDGFSAPFWRPTHATLGLPDGWDLVQIQFNMFNGLPQIVFWGGVGGAVSSTHLLGTANFRQSLVNHVPAVSIFLTAEQQVFPYNVLLNTRVGIASARDMTYTGAYQINGKERAMFMNVSPDRINIGAADEFGNLFPLVFFAQSWWDYVGFR